MKQTTKMILAVASLAATASAFAAEVTPDTPMLINDNALMMCTRDYNPVCGKDGKTYGNSCEATRQTIAIDYAGECSSYKPNSTDSAAIDKIMTRFTQLIEKNANNREKIIEKLQNMLEAHKKNPRNTYILQKLIWKLQDTTPATPSTPVLGMANPASVNCEKQGGKLEIRDEKAGQAGYCKLPSGKVCEEWALFRGECKDAVATTIDPSAEKELKNFPIAKSGQERHVIFLADKSRDVEGDFMVEIIPGKKMKTDCNRSFLSGKLTEKDLSGWGYTYYEFSSEGQAASTLMACPAGSEKEAFVGAQSLKVAYNSRLPLVIYTPAGYEVQYRVWEAKDVATASKK